MLLSRDYRRPFWRGLLHAVAVVFYSLCIALVALSLQSLFGGDISLVIRATLYVFLGIVSLGVVGYLIFFVPVQHILHQHVRAATVLIISTLGWLLVFLVIFLLGLVTTLPQFGAP